MVGPRLLEGAIVYDELSAVDDLPAGWTDEQDGGKYRLRKRADNSLFGYAVGPHSWKKFLFPPVTRLWRANRTGGSFSLAPEQEETPRYAFIGVRSCELHAIATQDKVFMGGKFVDSVYAARRKNAFIVAVNCSQAGGTCFCVSMKTGPKAQAGFDLALTEVIEEGQHYFVVEIGTEKGAGILAQIAHRAARAQEQRAADLIVERTAGQIGRTMDTTGIKELLYRNYEHPRWDDVASVANLRQLHDGLSDMFLLNCRRCHRSHRRARGAVAEVTMLQCGLFISPAVVSGLPQNRATGSG